MKLRNIVPVLMTLIAILFLSGGLGEGSVLQVYDRLPIPGVASSVYGATDITKPDLKKATAFNKYIEIDFTKNARGANDKNYLLYLDDGGSTDTLDCSTYVFGVFVRDTINHSGLMPDSNDDFSQYDDSSPGATNWIVKPLSHVFTIVPMRDAGAISSYDIDGEDGTITGIDDYELYWPALITLKYDKIMSDPYGTVTVLYRKDDNDDWEILPGLVNTSQGTVTTTFARDGFGTYCVVNLDGNFNEFPIIGGSGVSWSQQYVTTLWSKGIMSQTKTNGDFGLINGASEYNATRGEFAAMLVKGMRLPLRTELSERLFNETYNNFSDVDTGDDLVAEGVHYEDYYPQWVDCVYTSAKYGLFNGFREGDKLVFKPADSVTREQAAALIARAAKLKVDYMDDPASDKVLSALQKMYTDADSISIWARPYVLAVSKAKYMEGIPDPSDSKKKRFTPGVPITRAQTAKIVYKLLSQLKLL